MRNVFLLFMFFGLSLNVLSQEHGDEHEQHTSAKGHGEHRKNLIGLGFGYAYVHEGAEHGSTDENGILVPSIGLSYFRLLGKHWKIGLLSEIELDDYIIYTRELHRESALIVTVCGAYEPFHFFELLLGAGVEIERHRSFALIRTGVQFPIHLKKGWLIEPELLLDIKEGYNTGSFSLAVGYTF